MQKPAPMHAMPMEPACADYLTPDFRAGVRSRSVSRLMRLALAGCLAVTITLLGGELSAQVDEGEWRYEETRPGHYQLPLGTEARIATISTRGGELELD